MLYRTLFLAALLFGPAIAQEPVEVPGAEPDDQTAYLFPDIPGDAMKAAALNRAYQLNGNSMVGNNHMIDLSNEVLLARVVQTEKVTVTMPVPAPRPEEQLAKMEYVSNTCTRHGLRKVTHGKSWSCKR